MMRLALCGDGAVGKTSLRKRYMGKGFQANHLMTVGADFAMKRTEIDGKNVKFQIWDLAGQQSFKTVRSRFYKGVMGALCVFDITRKQSYQNIPKWINELWQLNGNGAVPIVLLGNKEDIRDRASIPKDHSQHYAEQLSEVTSKHGFDVDYFSTSAKSGLNVDEAFHNLGKKIIQQMEAGVIS